MHTLPSNNGTENLVKARRAAIEDSKHALDAAMAQQVSSQKEVVALLERKHSWSAADLERYMSLIRSEHVNDQAVREAKEAIISAENALEEARAQLERRERAQYHEEQIWSDTIRRNSTWVTFGLMGLNIFLLLSSLVIFEPWRRRRMVREVKNALEAHKTALDSAVAAASPTLALATSPESQVPATLPEPPAPATSPEPRIPAPTATAETEIDRSLERGETVVVGEVSHGGTSTTTEPKVLVSLSPDQADPVVEESPLTQDAVPDTAPEPEVPGAAPLTPEGVSPQDAIDIEEEVKAATDATPETWQEKITFIAHDVISDRVVSMRRVDFTTAVLQSAAAGAVIAAAAIAIVLRPR
jgi:sensitive to high expression protein 9